MNEIVFGKPCKPHAHHLAQKFVCFVQNRDSKLARTSMGKLELFHINIQLLPEFGGRFR